MKHIELSPTRSLVLPRPAGLKVVCTSVSINDEAVCLLVESASSTEVFARIETGFASFPKSQVAAFDATLVVSGSEGSRAVKLSGLAEAYPQVELLPDGQVLVVSSRCRRFPDGTHELNAKVHDSQGVLKGEFLIGDGVNDVQADPNGNIWVSYSDEGVYGNYGWGNGDGPIGASGLCCFNTHAGREWEFQAPDGLDSISDCYALNVCGSGVWAYYYTGFPIVQIDGSRGIRAWQNEISGAHALAVSKRHVLLYGSYKDPMALNLLEFHETTLQPVSMVTLKLPSAVDLQKSVVIGRGPRLHVFYQDAWYVFSIESLF